MTKIKTILIVPVCNCSFTQAIGGITCSFEVAKMLNLFCNDVRILDLKQISNHVYNNTFVYDNYENNFDAMTTYEYNYDKETTVVIYGEQVTGNPMNSKHVVRWILAPIGVNISFDIIKTWNPNDLVYYFNSEYKFFETSNVNKYKTVYKLLSSIHVNPNLINLNFPRSGFCHAFRKCHIHKSINYIHPDDSYQIMDFGVEQDTLIEIFNTYKFFISYDPLTFLNVMAASCGCISIVYKVEGKSKEEWLQSTTLVDYFKATREKELYGVAYGVEEIEYAINTMHLVKEQWNNIHDYCIAHTVVPFINDMENIDGFGLENTVYNNYMS